MKKTLSVIVFLSVLFTGTAAFGQVPIIKPFYIYLKEILDVAKTLPTDDYVLTYDATTELWGPEEATSGTTTAVEEGDVPVGDPDILTLDFAAADFILGEDPNTEVNIALDYANGQVATTDVHGFLSDTDWDTFNEKAAASHTMASHSDEDTYDISTTGDIHHGGFISTPYYNCGNSGASITIDWNNGNLQYVTLTAVGVDITFTEPPNPGRCELWIIQDGTGSRTIDWEHEISPKWPGGIEPTLSTGAGDIDVVVFTFIGGTTYRGLFNGDFN